MLIQKGQITLNNLDSPGGLPSGMRCSGVSCERIDSNCTVMDICNANRLWRRIEGASSTVRPPAVQPTVTSQGSHSQLHSTEPAQLAYNEDVEICRVESSIDSARAPACRLTSSVRE